MMKNHIFYKKTNKVRNVKIRDDETDCREIHEDINDIDDYIFADPYERKNSER